MLISKFDLYKGGWLDLVFKNRNHQYGAYALRNDYAGIMVKSMAATFFAFAFIGVTATIIARSKPIVTPPDVLKKVDVITTNQKIYEAKPKEIKKPQKAKPVKATEAPKAVAVRTQQVVTMKPAADPLAENPKPVEAGVAIANVDNSTGKSGENLPVNGAGEKPGTTTNAGTEPSTIIYEAGVEVMPEPIGGADAWAKFLQKNLRYPLAAQDGGIQGKTYVSFII